MGPASPPTDSQVGWAQALAVEHPTLSTLTELQSQVLWWERNALGWDGGSQV